MGRRQMTHVKVDRQLSLVFLPKKKYVNKTSIFIFVCTTVMYKYLVREITYLQEKRANQKAVNRRTDNIMSKSKRTKGHTTIYRILHRKLKIEQHEPH
jgi:hypothetical protein